MRKLIILLAILIAGVQFVEAKTRQVTTYNALPQINNNYGLFNPSNSDDYPKVSMVEGMIFQRTFENEDIYNRLNRIENRLYNRINTQASLSERLDTILQTVNPSALAGIPLNNLGQIEQKILGNTYSNEDPETRIIRLEKEMLGAMQSGEIQNRYLIIENAARHYNAFPAQQNFAGILPFTQQFIPQNFSNGNCNQSKGKSILKNILSGLAGNITGFTPPMSNYNYDNYSNNLNNPYHNPYNFWAQNGLSQSSNGYNTFNQSNNGYSYNNKNYGTGSSVQILNN